jgi:hypothetical protein
MFRALGILAVTCFLAACSDTSSSLTSTAVPTLLTIDPLKFQGPVRCGPTELQTYVVTVTDVTKEDDAGLIRGLVPVSDPATCPNPTSFGSPPIAVGHQYVAEIDGYDRPSCDLVRQVFPDGCVQAEAAGSRKLIDHATGTPIPPRFRWQCGEPNTDVDATPPNKLLSPTMALYATEVFVQGCEAETAVPATSEAGTSSEADAAAEANDDASGTDDSTSQPPDAAGEGG